MSLTGPYYLCRTRSIDAVRQVTDYLCAHALFSFSSFLHLAVNFAILQMMVNKIDRPNTSPTVRAICKLALLFMKGIEGIVLLGEN